MPTLYSSVIRLSTVHPATLTHLGGQHAHAAFLDIVRTVDGELAASLHDANARKPFTVSPLMGLPQGKNAGKPEIASSTQNGSSQRHEIYLQEGWQCWLRVTMLDDVLFRTFLEHFLHGGNLPSVRIGDAQFLVSEILTMPGSHPWAGYVALEDLQKRLDEPAPQKFAFELYTPTAFGWKEGLISPMPSPAFVFGNLARAWDALTGQEQAKVIEKYATENLVFSSFDLQTERMVLHNKTQLGAVGRFELIRAGNADEPLARALNLLADLAFYTGLGRKTTQGMGMVSRMK
jgi:CRISPR-associated endoribonuclease Cas6